MDKLYLIDGSSMLYRAFFAIRDLKKLKQAYQLMLFTAF